MKDALNALKWIIKNIFFREKKMSPEILIQQDFYFGMCVKIEKYFIALFCVSGGVKPENDFFGFFSDFLKYISKFFKNPRRRAREEEFKLARPKYEQNADSS
jgi:hypothetical protein